MIVNPSVKIKGGNPPFIRTLYAPGEPNIALQSDHPKEYLSEDLKRMFPVSKSGSIEVFNGLRWNILSPEPPRSVRMNQASVSVK